jgi:hypothetical protein
MPMARSPSSVMRATIQVPVFILSASQSPTCSRGALISVQQVVLDQAAEHRVARRRRQVFGARARPISCCARR